jgi:CheY-like chemotaxis protein
MRDQRLIDASILVIDDQDVNVRLLQRLLRRDGYTLVHGLTDPREAIARFTELAPDLVILDLAMPFVDGFEFLERTRPLVPADTYLPVLVVTANVMPEMRRRALAAGAHDFLAKPLDATEVLLRVKNLLETRRLHCLLRAQNADLEAEVRRRTTLLSLPRWASSSAGWLTSSTTPCPWCWATCTCWARPWGPGPTASGRSRPRRPRCAAPGSSPTSSRWCATARPSPAASR